MLSKLERLENKILPNGIDHSVNVLLVSVKTMLTEDICASSDPLSVDLVSRQDADAYVMRHRHDILARFDEVASNYQNVVNHLKTWRSWIENGEKIKVGFSDKKALLAKIDHGIEVLQEGYDLAYCIRRGKGSVFWYSRREVESFNNARVSNNVGWAFPFDLAERLLDGNIAKYKCNLPNKSELHAQTVSSETVLKGICLGDYIGQPYEALVSYSDFKPDEPYSLGDNSFTDDSAMAIAIYDASKSLVNDEVFRTVEYGISKRAYSMFRSSMRYYAGMLPDVGYGSRFYKWAIEYGNDYESYANGGAMRVGAIGAIFDSVDDVIRYAIVSAYSTHAHKDGEAAAVCTAVCVWLAVHGASKDMIQHYVAGMSDQLDVDGCIVRFDNFYKPVDDVLSGGKDIYTVKGGATFLQAMMNFLDSTDYMSCIANAMKYRCDADTVAAISGGIAAAYYGKVPFIDDIITSENVKKHSFSNRFIANKLCSL